MDPFNEPTEDGEEDMFDAMPDDGVSRSKRERERESEECGGGVYGPR